MSMPSTSMSSSGRAGRGRASTTPSSTTTSRRSTIGSSASRLTSPRSLAAQLGGPRVHQHRPPPHPPADARRTAPAPRRSGSAPAPPGGRSAGWAARAGTTGRPRWPARTRRRSARRGCAPRWTGDPPEIGADVPADLPPDVPPGFRCSLTAAPAALPQRGIRVDSGLVARVGSGRAGRLGNRPGPGRLDDADGGLQRAPGLAGRRLCLANFTRSQPASQPAISPTTTPRGARLVQLVDQLLGGHLQRREPEARPQVLADHLGQLESTAAAVGLRAESGARPGDPASRGRSGAPAGAAAPDGCAARARDAPADEQGQRRPSAAADQPAARRRPGSGPASSPAPVR